MTQRRRGQLQQKWVIVSRCLGLSASVGLALMIASCANMTPDAPVQNPPTSTVPSATSTAVPTALPIATPTNAPTISLGPVKGGPKTQVAVTGRGFPPKIPVSLRIAPVPEDGNSLSFGGVVTDEQGRIGFSFIVPDRWPNGVPITENKLALLAADATSSIKAIAEFEFLVVAPGTPGSIAGTRTVQPSATPSPPQTMTASVSTAFVNVRAGPGLNTSFIARLDQGQTISLLGRTADDVWVQVRIPAGQQGWVPAVSIAANVSIDRLPVTALPEATPTWEGTFPTSAYVIVKSTMLRSGPGGNYSLIKRLNQGQDLALVGRDAVGSWVQVYLSDSVQGWVLADHVDADGPISALPVTTSTSIPPFATLVPGPVAYSSGGPLQLRAGPGTNYQLVIVSALARDQAMGLLGRNGAATWVQVRLPDGQAGWVTTGSIRASMPVTDLPVIADPKPSVTLIPAAVGLGASVQVNADGYLSNQEILVALVLAGTDRKLIVARGTTNSRGSAQLLFAMPGLWADGTVIAKGDLNVVAGSLDGTVSASTFLRFLR